MGLKLRVWLGEDHDVMHHAEAGHFADMSVVEAAGVTDCGLEGSLHQVHAELVDSGILCEGCIAASGVAPALAGEDHGPV